MTVVAYQPVTAPPLPQAEPTVHQWTREEYYRMGEAGLFLGQRVELIGGQVIDMSPIGSAHALGVDMAADVLRAVFPAGYYIRAQHPIQLLGASDPQPDVAVVEGNRHQYRDRHPTSAAVIVEVADTTLAYDRGAKASLYPSAAILDYWVVNLRGRQVEVFRDPQPDAAQPFGYRYAPPLIFLPGQSFAPLAAPGASIRVDDLLP